MLLVFVAVLGVGTHYAPKIEYYAFWHCPQNGLLCSKLCLTVAIMLVIVRENKNNFQVAQYEHLIQRISSKVVKLIHVT